MDNGRGMSVRLVNKKYQFISGKLIPYSVIANVDLVIGLILAYAIFNIPIIGSVRLLFGVPPFI